MFPSKRTSMNELTLKVIGCGDAFASGGRNHSCFFLKINRAGVLLDLGGTAFAGLKQHSVDQSQVDYIIISHLHGEDRKSTRLNSSHVKSSYAVFCLKKKNNNKNNARHIRI